MKFFMAIVVFLWVGLVAPLWFLLPFSVLTIMVTPCRESAMLGFFMLIFMSSLPMWSQALYIALTFCIFYTLIFIKNSLKIPQFNVNV